MRAWIHISSAPTLYDFQHPAEILPPSSLRHLKLRCIFPYAAYSTYFSMFILRYLPLLSLLMVNVSAKCYGIGGGDMDSSYVPCNASAKVSACCASKKWGGDVCIDGGLCLGMTGGWQGFIYADGCT